MSIARCVGMTGFGIGCLVQGAVANAATIAVDTTAAATSTSATDGKCSLAEAIQAANLDQAVDTCPAGLGRDVITLPAGTFEFLLPYSSADTALALPAIMTELTIAGPADGTATLTFNAAATTLQFLRVAGTGKATLQGLTFSQAHYPTLVENYGQLSVEDCTFQNNGNVADPRLGRCILNRAAATLSVASSRFISNHAGSIQQDPNGAGSMSVKDSEFIANFSTAIFVFRAGSTLTVEGSKFDQNAGRPPAIDVRSNANASVTDSTFTDNVSDNAFPGAIQLDAAVLSVARTVFSGNRGHSGGAIAASIPTSLTISETTFANNSATVQGGALQLAAGPGSINIRNSTFSGNSTPELGGAIWADLGADVSLNNVTVTGNTCREGCGLFLAQGSTAGTFTLSNTLIARNGNRDCYTQGGKFLVSAGHNLVGRTDACTIVEGTADQLGTAAEPLDPGLGPLDDNGGPTQTHALLWNSLALDAGSPDETGAGACEPKDQTGTARPVGASCDIGAFEGSLSPPETGAAGAGGATDAMGGGRPGAGGVPGDLGEGGAQAGAQAGASMANGGLLSDGGAAAASGKGEAEAGTGGDDDDDDGYVVRRPKNGDGDCSCRIGRERDTATPLALLALLSFVARRRQQRLPARP